MLQPLTRATLPDQAARALKQFIIDQQFLPGVQLPSERQLTELLGVSRTVVREALQLLVAEGLLVKAPNRGIFLREFDTDLVEQQLRAMPPTSTQTRSLLEVRAALEIGALTFIAQRVTATELADLAALVAEMRRRMAAGLPIGDQDQAFHDALLQAVHNPTFSYFKRLIQEAIGVSALGFTLTNARPADRHMVETAEQIVAALGAADVDGAQRAMRAHLLTSRPPEQARVFLFVDDEEIAELHHLTRRVTPAHRYPHNPVLKADYPWEGDGVLPAATVLYDREQMIYQLWYHGWQQLSPREELFALCYATSLDGIHWRKPALGLVEFEGSGDNNLLWSWGNLLQGDVTSATILPPVAAQQPPVYHMVYVGAGLHSLGVGVATSSDGLQWKPATDKPVTLNEEAPVGDLLYCLPEPDANRIAAYYRIPLRARANATIGRMESYDLRHWTGHRPILTTDDADPADAELVGLTPFRYGMLTLGLLWVHRREAGTTELQLACSRDGVTWRRVGERQPLLMPGVPGAFDQQSVSRATSPIVMGNELWFYYAGAVAPLHSRREPAYQMGLATLTVDRFVALEADAEEGAVTTTVLTCGDQTHLLVNAVVNPGGYLLTEVLDAAGNPIAGFTRDDALPFAGSTIYQLIAWRTQPDLRALTTQPIRFRFILHQAALYAFRLAHPNARASDLLAGIC
ncbi:MAG: GntR family transcriptional regulator [Caldilineaceae bacterium]|nr:GntR family transcriptional regulator [Caldilineaceae bacterium]